MDTLILATTCQAKPANASCNPSWTSGSRSLGGWRGQIEGGWPGSTSAEGGGSEDARR